jgi:hypothetical protein
VGIELTLPIGVTISSVAFDIHSAQPISAPADDTGTIDTSNGMAAALAEISYPASTADTVTFTATTDTGELCTGTSGPFTVTSGGQSLVGVTITCALLMPDSGVGPVRVN